MTSKFLLKKVDHRDRPFLMSIIWRHPIPPQIGWSDNGQMWGEPPKMGFYDSPVVGFFIFATLEDYYAVREGIYHQGWTLFDMT